MPNGSSFLREKIEVVATSVVVSEDRLEVMLSDGRTVGAPIAWYPRLQEGSPRERNCYEFNGGGEGIHWPNLDEDISVKNLLNGEKSGESKSSLSEWKKERKKASSPAARYATVLLNTRKKPKSVGEPIQILQRKVRHVRTDGAKRNTVALSPAARHARKV